MIGTNKFKVGDRVIIKSGNYSVTGSGSEGIIKSIVSEGPDGVIKIEFHKIIGRADVPCTYDVWYKDVGHLIRDWDD